MTNPSPQGSAAASSANNWNTLSIVGLCLCCVPVVGAVLCVVALLQIRRSGEKGAPLAIAGIALSIASLLVLAVGGAGAMFLLRSNGPPPVTDSAPMR